jgi:hypothetical protein
MKDVSLQFFFQMSGLLFVALQLFSCMADLQQFAKFLLCL